MEYYWSFLNSVNPDTLSQFVVFLPLHTYSCAED